MAKAAIKKYEKLLTNAVINLQTYEILKAKNRRSDKDQKTFDDIALMIAVRMQYAPGEPARIEANTLIENYNAEKIRITNLIQQWKNVKIIKKKELLEIESARKS